MGERVGTWRSRIVGHGEEDPTKLLANPMNWRIHPKKQQQALSGALGEVGWIQQVIVNRRTGHVIDGHLRIELAISHHEFAVPVVYVDLDEDEERLALATFDPLSAMAVTDDVQLERLLLELSPDSEALQGMLSELADENGLFKRDVVEDEAPELAAVPITQPGDLWLLGDHRLLCGDSTRREDVEWLMASASAAFIWGDPPYGIALDTATSARRRGFYGGTAIDESNAPWDETLSAAWVDVWTLHVQPGGYLASWTPYQGIGTVERHALAAGLLWLNLFTWVKENPAPGFPEYLAKSCEHAAIFRKPGRGRHVGTSLVRDYAITPVTAQADRHGDHPSPKRPDVIAPVIDKLTPAGGLIADPFLGSGTTLVVAEQLGRRCYGMELEPAYCDVSVQRWESLTGRKATREPARAAA